MQTYTVRSKEGTMMMRLVGKPADDMIEKFDGEWRTYQPENGKRTVAYEIECDGVWVHESPFGAFRIFLWAGTKIIKN